MQNIRPLIVKSRLCACEINGHYTGGRRPHVLSRHCAQVPGADRGGAAVLVLAEPVGLRHGLLRAHPGKLGPFPRRTVPSPRYVSFCLQLFFRVRACARNAVVSCLPLHLPRRGESTHDRGGVGVDQSRTWKHASVRMCIISRRKVYPANPRVRITHDHPVHVRSDPFLSDSPTLRSHCLLLYILPPMHRRLCSVGGERGVDHGQPAHWCLGL